MTRHVLVRPWHVHRGGAHVLTATRWQGTERRVVLNWLVWAPVWAPVLWVTGVAIGLVSGFATLKLNPILSIPLAVVWIYLGLRPPRLVGIAGALVGLGIEWLWLLATAETICLQSQPPVCGWSLPYGPSWSSDPNAWSTVELTLAVIAVAVLGAGVALTVQFAWRLRGGRSGSGSALRSDTSDGVPRPSSASGNATNTIT